MHSYRLGAIGIVTTFFIIIFSTVLLPMVLFNPTDKEHRSNNYTKVPANVTLCDAVTGQSNTHVRVVRVLVQQVDARGHGAESVISVGPLP